MTKPPGTGLPTRLLTLAQVSALLSCSIKTLRRRVAARELPVIRDGRLIRVDPDELDRFLRARTHR